VSVLRNGRLIDTIPTATTSESNLIEMMLGYDLGAFYPDRHESTNARDVIAVRNLSGGSISDVSFSAREGEIVGFTGLAGMGQDEIPYLIVGSEPRDEGDIRIAGSPLPASITSAI